MAKQKEKQTKTSETKLKDKKNTVAKEKIINVVKSDIKATESKLLKIFSRLKTLPLYILLAVLAVLVGMQSRAINAQKKDILTLNENLQNLQNQAAQEIVNNRRVFVCNMEEIYKQLNVESRNTDFELKIAKLNDDVSAAQRKIKNLKDAKVKADFTDVYLNSLLAKRDKMVEEYQNALHETMVKINQAMAAVATEKKATTIFRSPAVTALTKYTIDVTNDILQKINEIK